MTPSHHTPYHPTPLHSTPSSLGVQHSDHGLHNYARSCIVSCDSCSQLRRLAMRVEKHDNDMMSTGPVGSLIQKDERGRRQLLYVVNGKK